MSGWQALTGSAVVRRLVWRSWTRSVIGNAVGGIAVGFIIWTYGNLFTGGLSRGRQLWGIVVVGSGTFAVLVALSFPVARAISARSAAWLVEARTPNADDLARVAKIPRLNVFLSLGLWSVGAVVTFVLYIGVVGYRIEAGPLQVVATLLGFAYGAMVGAVLSYLLVERELRPLLGAALAAEPERWPPSMGVGRRLILAWFAVAGAPLVLLAYYSFGVLLLPPSIVRSHDILGRIALALASSCILAFVVGLAVFVYGGRAITAPLGRVQHGLRLVAQGDLSAHVEVGEVGEIGLLQAGFNQMVRGLQERERLHDLFGRHVGTEVATHALQNTGGLGGERCEASALFVDVIGSTRLAESANPDDVVAILNDFFGTVVRIVRREGGFVNKFHGDGALCVFGAPTRQPDHAERALRAARALAAELATLDGVATAIGVSSGEVVAGNVGASDRYEFTVIGDPVNEASRLSDEAKQRPRRVLASGTTVRRATAEAALWTQTASVTVRGRTGQTEVFEPASSSSGGVGKSIKRA